MAPSSEHLQFLHGKQRDPANLKRLERCLRFPVTWNTHIPNVSCFCARDWENGQLQEHQAVLQSSEWKTQCDNDGYIGTSRHGFNSKFPEKRWMFTKGLAILQHI